MKAISLWQPFATAMALELKANETRSWSTSYRGPLAICASKRKIDPEFHYLIDAYFPRDGIMPYGCVVCVVDLYQVMPTIGSCGFTDRELEFGDYSPGRFFWRTRNCQPLKEPVPVRGQMGLFELPLEVQAAVQRQIAELRP